MPDRFSTQFLACSKEILRYDSSLRHHPKTNEIILILFFLSFKSEEWNSKLKSRISDYLFFLNGRGLELLSSFLARTGC